MVAVYPLKSTPSSPWISVAWGVSPSSPWTVANHQSVLPIFSLTVVSLCILLNLHNLPSPIVTFYRTLSNPSPAHCRLESASPRSFSVISVISVANHQNVLPIFSLTVVPLCILLNPRHGPSPIAVFYHLKSIQSSLANHRLLNPWDIPSQYHFIREWEPPAHMRESGESLSASSLTSSLRIRTSAPIDALFHHIPIHGKFPFMAKWSGVIRIGTWEFASGN